MAEMGSIRKIWPQIPNSAGEPAPEYKRLHEYFTTFCHAAGLGSQTAAFATIDLANTLDMVARIRERAAATNKYLDQMTRNDLLVGMRQNPDRNWRYTTDHHIANSLCLAISLWIALDITPSEAAPDRMLSHKFQWDNTTPLSVLITDAIPTEAPVNPGSLSPMDPRLTLEYLKRYHGFTVAFTDNLAKHLDLQTSGGQETLLFVFKHKIFLRNKLVYPQTSPLPLDLAEETLDTLNLLLPHEDPDTRKFLDRLGMADIHGLGWCRRPAKRVLDAGKYKYWRSKLERLSRIVVAGPTGLRQFIPGRGPGAARDFVTFWMAVVAVIVLTLLSVGLSAASVAIGALQYKLALAQACATLNSTQLPGWC